MPAIFSCRYLPPEIGCLTNLEHLDLSFNKMRNLPDEITSLSLLISLKVANNKLIDLPSRLSSLQRLENFDLSNNRLTSLECLELELMHNLRVLNLGVCTYDTSFNSKCINLASLFHCEPLAIIILLFNFNYHTFFILSSKLTCILFPMKLIKHNRLRGCRIPSWICCNLDGNAGEVSIDESTEMDVIQETHGSPCNEEGSLSPHSHSHSHPHPTHTPQQCVCVCICVTLSSLIFVLYI